MKKLSKLMALLLSISMILSLFAACGDDKKTADNGKNNDNASAPSSWVWGCWRRST